MAFCVSNSHSVSFYSNILDLWLLWCDNSDLGLLNLCPKTPLLCPKLVYHYTPNIYEKKYFLIYKLSGEGYNKNMFLIVNFII